MKVLTSQIILLVLLPLLTFAKSSSSSPSSSASATSKVISPVLELNDSDYTSKFFDSDNSKWLILFYAPWCGHCHRFKPVFEAAAIDVAAKAAATKSSKSSKKTTMPAFAQVNVDANPDLAGRFFVSRLPTLFYFDRNYTSNPTVWTFSTMLSQTALVEFAGAKDKVKNQTATQVKGFFAPFSIGGLLIGKLAAFGFRIVSTFKLIQQQGGVPGLLAALGAAFFALNWILFKSFNSKSPMQMARETLAQHPELAEYNENYDPEEEEESVEKDVDGKTKDNVKSEEEETKEEETKEEVAPKDKKKKKGKETKKTK